MDVNQNLKLQIEQEDIPKGKKKTLLAAIDLFGKQGYAATSTSQIAKEGGISEATIFKYFKTKKQLLQAMLEPMIIKLIPDVQDEFATAFVNKSFDTLDDLLLALITNRYNFLYKNRELFKILINELLVDENLRENLTDLAKNTTENFDDDFNQLFSAFVKKPISTLELFTKMMQLLIGYFVQKSVITGKLEEEPIYDLSILAKQLKISILD